VFHRPILKHAECASVTTHKTENKWFHIDIMFSLKYQKLWLPEVCATFGLSDLHFPKMKVNFDIISIRSYETFRKVTFCLWYNVNHLSDSFRLCPSRQFVKPPYSANWFSFLCQGNRFDKRV
jgi:hypothetical protein